MTLVWLGRAEQIPMRRLHTVWTILVEKAVANAQSGKTYDERHSIYLGYHFWAIQ